MACLRERTAPRCRSALSVPQASLRSGDHSRAASGGSRGSAVRGLCAGERVLRPAGARHDGGREAEAQGGDAPQRDALLRRGRAQDRAPVLHDGDAAGAPRSRPSSGGVWCGFGLGISSPPPPPPLPWGSAGARQAAFQSPDQRCTKACPIRYGRGLSLPGGGGGLGSGINRAPENWGGGWKRAQLTGPKAPKVFLSIENRFFPPPNKWQGTNPLNALIPKFPFSWFT